MFKLESYVTPLLMGYIDQYVALKKEDFQLSLWGGDAVLNKLDLRLDVIEKAIQLPIVFKSGHIHELRLHVPWTSLGSEPVIITINTIECILKLRENKQDDAASATSSKSVSQAPPKTPRSSRGSQQQDLDLPPGYIQSLINRILNNVNIVVNNLILKFVEDDIVLSVNVKSAECYSVNSNWMRDFVDLTSPELALRRVIDFSDLTICLDKRNASGKIDTYQDPLLYRCPITCRIHSSYDGLYSKYPSVTKINFLCENLEVSLTDTQLPMFFRLMELCIAIYYGTLELPGGSSRETSEAGEATSSAGDPKAESDKNLIPADMEVVDGGYPGYHEDPQQGWMSWAWSYVPQILPTEEDYEYEDEEGATRARKKNEPALLVIGFCVNKASLVFKLTETLAQSHFYGAEKVNFKPCMVWHAEGISMEALIKGTSFFDVQFGVTHTRIECKGEAICGTKDLDNTDRDPCFFTSGSQDTDHSLKLVNFTSNSLFDPGGCENQGEPAEYIFDPERHNETFTETFGMHKYGAFWMDYLYTMELPETTSANGSQSSVSSSSDQSHARENSCMRFVFGPAHLIVCSSAVQRVHKFVHCALDHEYEPYSKPHPDEVEPLHTHPTEEEVARLEEFIATRSQHFTLLEPRITVLSSDLPQYDVTHKLRAASIHSKKKSKSKTSTEPAVPAVRPASLPAVVVHAARADFQVTTTMYPKHVVKIVSALANPSANLLHHCHSHIHIKAFGVQVGVTALEPCVGYLPLQPLLQPVSGVYYLKKLLLPKYWKNPLQPKTETMIELPQFTINASKAQVLLCSHVARTWMDPAPNPHQMDEYSLLDDVFKSVGLQHHLLQLTVTGVESKMCCTDAARAYSGVLSTVQVMLIHMEDGTSVVTPLLYGPLHTKSIHTVDFFTKVDSPSSTECRNDLLSFTCQLATEPNMPQAHCALYLNMHGIVGCLDPVLLEWLTYSPTKQLKRTGLDTRVSVTAESEVKVNQPSPEGGSQLNKKSHGSRSDSTMTVPTGSHTQSKSQTQSYNLTHTSPKLKSEGKEPDLTQIDEASEWKKQEQDNTWGHTLAKVYPLIKITQVQVDIENMCAFFPLRHVRLSEPSMNIPYNLHREYYARGLPHMVVVSCPSVNICSAGHKPVSPAQEIPIRALEHSVASEKLPWSVELSQCSLYTIHSTQTLQYGVKPLGVSATLAVTTKYHPPTSDNITSLGLCIHADMDAAAVACSKPQMKLAFSLLMDYYRTACKVYDSLVLMEDLYNHVLPTRSDSLSSSGGATPGEGSRPRGTSLSSPTKSVPQRVASTSSMLEQTEPPLTSITETSDTFSLRGSPSTEIEDMAAVKLSLWIQWTLPKLVAKLYAQNKQGHAVCLKAEMEDLTSSIDIQQVYAKVKCKAGTFNITHLLQTDLGWKKGPLQGLLLTCTEQLARPLQLAGNRIWTVHDNKGTNLFTGDETKPRDHGFLTLTFTRALRRSVKRKMKKVNVEGMLDFEKGGEMLGEQGLIHLNEVCLNVEPCDVVLNCPVLANVLDVFTACTSLSTPPSSLPNKDKPDEDLTRRTLPLLTSSLLPLMYVNATDFRLFVPECDCYQQRHTMGSNVCVLQVSSMSLLPQADNPLPRNIQEKDIYKRAVQAGITEHPGSEVEDRQYQIDIQSLSLSTGCWEEIVARGNHNSTHAKDPHIQNPALEWNTQKTLLEPKEVKLIPIASSFDLRIVAAPAVVYTPISNPAQACVVCGYSLEVNATSDMDFYLSLKQASLLNRIFQSNISPLLGEVTSTDTHSTTRKRRREGHVHWEDHSFHDSGVESDTSTMNTVMSRTAHMSPGSKVTEGLEAKVDPWSHFTAFDVLLTAGKISFMVYSHEEIAYKELTPDAGKLNRPSKSDLELKEIHPTCSSPLSEGGLSRLWPFLYIYFSQPHTLISCIPGASQKAELSCFDMVLKGAKPGFWVEEEGKLIPDPSDFSIHWLETRQGKPQPKTGIPPSLYTFRLTDFLQHPAVAELCIERPLKLNLSISRIQQILGFVETLQGVLDTHASTLQAKHPSSTIIHEDKLKPIVPAKTRQVTGKSPPTENTSFLKTLASIKSLHCHTVQFVVAMDTVPHPKVPMVVLALSGVEMNVALFAHPSEAVSSIESSIVFRDLQLKTSYASKTQPLLGPFCPAVHLQLTWGQHSGPVHWPLTLAYVDCGLLQLHCGQEHVLCLELVSQHLNHYVNSMTPTPPEASKQSFKEHKVAKKIKESPDMGHIGGMEVTSTSADDLRAGHFSYVQEEVAFDELPQPGEIMFSCDYETGQASMSWCYTEPRVLTELMVTPVPFTAPQPLDASLVDESMAVPCMLQHYSLLTRCFEDYAEFALSENKPCDVHLPEVRGHDPYSNVAVSQVWRVLILKPPKQQEEEEEEIAISSFDTVEPLVSPLTLAASIKVDSCFVPALVPIVQCSLNVGCLQFCLHNHFQHLAQETPGALHPFEVVPSSCVLDQEWLVMCLKTLSVQGSVWWGKQPRLALQGSTSVECKVIEYHNLTERPLVDTTNIKIDAVCTSKEEEQNVKLEVYMDSMCVQVDQAIIHTLNTAALTWNQLHCDETATRIIPNHYIFCNDTQEALKVRQVDTDESVVVMSREALPYSWRSPAHSQQVQVSMESLAGLWSEPVSVDTVGTYVRVLEKASHTATLVVRVRQLTNVQKQVVITGAVTVASRLSQHLEVKIITSRPLRESSRLLEAGQALPSYVGEADEVRALRVRLAQLPPDGMGGTSIASKTPWSQEILISGDKAKESRLVKVPMQDKNNHMHVWCHTFVQKHKDQASEAQHEHTLVLFTPLFIVRNQLPAPLLMNIYTPRLQSATQLEIEGRGLEKQLHMMGGDLTHTITYQLNPHMQPSSPPITLSSGMIEQVDRVAVDNPDIDVMAYEWCQKPRDIWPYNLMDDHKAVKDALPMTDLEQMYQDIMVPQSTSNTESPGGEDLLVPSGENITHYTQHPNIELQISLCQKWAGCNTVLIDIVPYTLVVNQTPLDLVLYDIEADKQWPLPTNNTFAPPQFEGTITIGVVYNKQSHLSEPITLSDEDNTSRYLPSLAGVLYMQGHLSLPITIRQNGKTEKMCYLAVHSTCKEGMRVLTITERFSLSNWSPLDLSVLPYSIPIGRKVKLLHERKEAIRVPGCAKPSSADSCTPLLIWETASEPMADVYTSDYVQYVSIKTTGAQPFKSQAPHSLQWEWSYPVRLRISQNGTRETLSVTLPHTRSRSWRTSCMTLTCQEQQCMVYLTICEDRQPPIHIHNNCSFPLYFGQSYLGTESNPEVTIQEETEMTGRLPTCPPHADTYYAFPEINTNFPDLRPPSPYPKLHLAGLPGHHKSLPTSTDDRIIIWSNPIDLDSEHAVFAHVPDISDVKVHVTKEGNTTHVYIDPVSRAEISAKEIRSRIKGKDKVRMEKSMVGHEVLEELTPAHTPGAEIDHNMVVEPEEEPIPAGDVYFDLNLLCRQATIMLQDDTSVQGVVSELLCLTLDNVGLSCYPKLDIARSTSTKPKYDQSLVVCIGDLQLDNQQHGKASYDFPVVLIRVTEEDKDMSEYFRSAQFLELSLEEKLGIIMNKGVMCVNVGFYKDPKDQSFTLQSLKLGVKPLVLFVEDTFLYQLLKQIDKLIPTPLSQDIKLKIAWGRLPPSVKLSAAGLSQPVKLEHLCIEPISLLASIHASLKIFIASDNTPLRFGQFEKKSLYTNSQQLSRSLAMHYASAALFRAGWVVGSLEILGNPTGLARNIGNGIADLFRMPYQGLTRGPGAFIGGVTRGMGSLIRHVSAGTLTSITNFASSVSRNMERLSLDQEHLHRQELSRRNKPTGVSDGLVHGLSGFGISLLGAIAGIADQPLQCLTQPNPSATRVATGLVSGVGKGLMGVVTKPIGGAAELVSMTGMGLLQGAGLTRYPSPRHKALSKRVQDYNGSLLKLTQKLLPSAPCTTVLACVRARHSAPAHDSTAVLLLLTPEVLFVVDCGGDMQQQAYAMADISCQESGSDSTIIYIVPSTSSHGLTEGGDGDKEDIANKDRVAEFIDALGSGHDLKLSLSEPRTSTPKRAVQHRFQLDIHDKELFLAMFEQGQRKIKGQGFVL